MEKMLTSFIRPRLMIMVGADAFLVAACLYMAYLISLASAIPADDLARYFRILPLVLVTKMWTFGLFRLYRGLWRYTSLVDLVNVGKAVCVSSSIIILWVLTLTNSRDTLDLYF